MGGFWKLSGLLLGATVAANPAPAAPKEDVLREKLRARVEAIDRGLDGVLGVSIRDLKTGASIDIRPDEVFPQASVIKLAVLYELYAQADEGRLDLAERVTPPLPRVGGGGVLQHLGPHVTLPWRDLAVLMMGWSDNEATNRIIEKVGMDAVNARLDGLGLPKTRLRRRMMDVEAAKRGEENVSTPSEMRRLIEAIHAGRGLKPALAKELAGRAATEKSTPFRRGLPADIAFPVLDKDGELDAVRTAAAVVDLPGRPYSAAIMATYLRRDGDGEAAIRDISAALHETFDRLARSSELGRVVR